MSARASVLAGLWLGLLLPVSAAAQTGSVGGAVTDRVTGEPVPGAEVYLEGTSYGALTQENGRYLILNVPVGVYHVVAHRIGYAAARHDNARIRAHESAVVDFQLRTSALRLEDVVVTGVADPTSGLKVPFTVGKVTSEDLPVPPTSPEISIRGRVAGARVTKGSGQPGGGASVVLRGHTSINRPNEPLYVVDGVILAESLVDLEALDIETIEVIKGAAAASLFGSRAANGVIQIRTARGRDVADGDTRMVVRTEFGNNLLGPHDVRLTKSHPYLLDANGDFALDENGQRQVDPEGAGVGTGGFMDNPYRQTFDHLAQFFDPNEFYTTSISLAQNTRSTNFYASFTDRRESGIVLNHGGFGQRSFRLNLDHRVRDDLNVSASGMYSKGRRDRFQGDPFYDLMFMPPDADLTVPNDDGEPYRIKVNEYALQANPLYAIWAGDEYDDRGRVLGGVDVRYSPANWFSLEGNVSYDRSDVNYHSYVRKGYKELNAVSSGSISKEHDLEQALNAAVSASFLRSFGALTARAQFQYLGEAYSRSLFSAGSSNFVVQGVSDIDAGTNEAASSSRQDVRSEAATALLGLDYAGKYIGDVMVRRDGSSLFGRDERYNNYYRGSIAYRVTEEPWWAIDPIGELKLRVSQGTAGNRPRFDYQYETWTISGGTVGKETLGNRNLRPELATELELGLDMIVLDRYSVEITRVFTRVEDQLLQVPLPAVYGYASQWQNAGTIESDTWEGTVQASLIDGRDFDLNIGFVADRTRGEITQFDRPCYRYESAFYLCRGSTLGTMYGHHFLRSLDELAEQGITDASQFAVNDDGLVVWVGPDATPLDGVAQGLWGTSGTVATAHGERDFGWGRPILALDSAGNHALAVIGDANPDLNLGLSADLRWKGVRLTALLDAQTDFDIYNNTKQWTYRDDNHGDLDQAGKDPALKKPVVYYKDLYATNTINDWFVEDGSYLKLREVSLRYTFDRDRIRALFGTVGASLDHLSFGVIGRNLLTFSPYSGFDPEVGQEDATRIRYDGFGYPNFMTLSAFVEVEF